MIIVPPDPLTVAIVLALPDLAVLIFAYLISRRNDTW